MKANSKIVFKSFFFCLLAFFLLSSFKLQQTETIVVFQTTQGFIKIKLYEETGMHKDNFVKLVNDGFYDGVLFHRVIKDFMIQTGDPDSKNAKQGQALGSGGPGYTVPAEIYASLYHKKGAVAAARMGDNVNPNRESSGSQFYIVIGKTYSLEQLLKMENSNMHPRFTEEQKQIYTTSGGTAHLDYTYTVFGEVIEGLDIAEKIALVEVDPRNRPLDDIKIIKAYIVK